MLEIGSRGTLITATRGTDGPGEVQVTVDGGSEVYMAYSDKPLPQGTVVAIYEIYPGRRVDVEAIKGAF